MLLYLVMSILIEQNLEIHPFQDLLNWDNFDTIHWTMDMRMMFEEDTFDHIEFIFSMEFCQHGLSDGCNWAGLGQTITNYKVSTCPLACHRLRPILPANLNICVFLCNFFVEVFVFNIWVPDLFGCRRIWFFGCHFMPLLPLTNIFVMLSLEQWACACIHKRTESLLKVQILLYQSLLKYLQNCWTFWYSTKNESFFVSLVWASLSSQSSFTKGRFEQLQIRGCLHVHMSSLAHAWSFLQGWLVVLGFDCLWLCLCMYVQLYICLSQPTNDLVCKNW